MRLHLSGERRTATVDRLCGFFRSEFDEELSGFRAEQILDFMLTALGPPLYNQAVADARAFMMGKLEDIEGELYEPDESR